MARKFELLYVFPEGERVVGMCTFKDQVLIATDCAVYRVKDDVVEEVSFVTLAGEDA